MSRIVLSISHLADIKLGRVGGIEADAVLEAHAQNRSATTEVCNVEHWSCGIARRTVIAPARLEGVATPRSIAGGEGLAHRGALVVRGAAGDVVVVVPYHDPIIPSLVEVYTFGGGLIAV